MKRSSVLLILLMLSSTALSAACRSNQPPAKETSAVPPGPTALPSQGSAAAPPPPLPEGLALDRPCPDQPASDPNLEESGIIPLKRGLTLANIWNVNAEDPDRECLTQVQDTDAVSVTVTNTCPSDVDRQILTWTRRICRADLRDAYMYHPSTRTSNPLIIGGTTKFSLSSRALRELRNSGRTRHRFIYVASHWQDRPDKIDEDRDGELGSPQDGTLPVVVNDRVVDLPVMRVSGLVGGQALRATILQNEPLPLVLEYLWPSGFSVRFTRISFPGSEIERRLANDEPVDVYGIYFDFANDIPRPESEPVLREIADLLVAHPTWALSISGHTDNVGGTAANLDLSKRRSASVRQALIERYGIGAERLHTGGFGASQPKATNDTAQGRAANRRVELVRQ